MNDLLDAELCRNWLNVDNVISTWMRNDLLDAEFSRLFARRRVFRNWFTRCRAFETVCSMQNFQKSICSMQNFRMKCVFAARFRDASIECLQNVKLRRSELARYSVFWILRIVTSALISMRFCSFERQRRRRRSHYNIIVLWEKSLHKLRRNIA